jgi:hypothetical protein
MMVWEMLMPVLSLLKFCRRLKRKKQAMAVLSVYQKTGMTGQLGAQAAAQVCAFTAAWEHPEEFARVFSAIGTYTGLRGADRYPYTCS